MTSSAIDALLLATGVSRQDFLDAYGLDDLADADNDMLVALMSSVAKMMQRVSLAIKMAEDSDADFLLIKDVLDDEEARQQGFATKNQFLIASCLTAVLASVPFGFTDDISEQPKVAPWSLPEGWPLTLPGFGNND